MASFNGQNKNFCKSGISTCGTDSLQYLQAHLKTIGVGCFIRMMYFLFFCFIFLSIILCIIPSGLSLFSVAY